MTQKTEKISWPVWLRAYGYRELAKTLGLDEKTAYNWQLTGALPRDKFKRKIVKLSGGVLDFNSFFGA